MLPRHAANLRGSGCQQALLYHQKTSEHPCIHGLSTTCLRPPGPQHLQGTLQLLYRVHKFPWTHHRLEAAHSLCLQQGPDAIQVLRTQDCIELALPHLEQSHTALPDGAYLSLLKACKKRKALDQVRHVHAHLTRHRQELNEFIGDYLVVAFAKCGSLEDASWIFYSLSRRTVFSWTSMISAYTDYGRGGQALEMYKYMQEDGLEPNSYTLASLLKASGSVLDVECGKALHQDAALKGLASDVFVGSALVSMYGKCSCICEAQQVFCELRQHDLVSWSALLSAYVEQGLADKALLLYRQMQEEGIDADEQTLVIALHACGDLSGNEGSAMLMGELSSTCVHAMGRALHAYARRKGIVPNAFVTSALIRMYGKCGMILEAEYVGEELLHCNIVPWNTMFSAYVEHGHAEKALRLYIQMQAEGMIPNQLTFVSAFQACAVLRELKEGDDSGNDARTVAPREICQALYLDAQRLDVDSNSFVGSTFISLYGKCGTLEEGERVFDRLSTCDVVVWNALLSVYVEHGEVKKAFQLYRQIEEDNINSNQLTFVSILQACIMLAEEEITLGKASICLEIGQAFHVDAERKSFILDAFVCSSLVKMYATCGSLMEAECVFNGFLQHDEVLWNTLGLAYVEQGQGTKALQLFTQMQVEGIVPSKQAFVVASQACGSLAENEQISAVQRQISDVCLQIGRGIYTDVLKSCFTSDVFVGSTLVSMFGKCGAIAEAEDVFASLWQRNIVSWNAMLTAFVKQCQGEKALKLYRQMVEEGARLNKLTFVISLQACGEIAEKDEALVMDGQALKVVPLEIGRALHADARKKSFCSDAFVRSTLVSMYGKCGTAVDAVNVFTELSLQDGVLWCAILSAYVEHGYGDTALQLYRQILEEGVSSNNQMFAIAIQACSVLAEKEEPLNVEGQHLKVVSLGVGKALHGDTQRRGCTSDIYVGNTLISMYGKCGAIVEAEKVFEGLAHRNLVSWSAMLAVYVEHGQGEKTLQVYRQMDEEGVTPCQQAFVSILQACNILTEKEDRQGQSSKPMSQILCEAFHAVIRKRGFSSNVFIGSVLVSIYGKSGSIAKAENVFSGLSSHNAVAVNAMLLAYLERGLGNKALDLYENIQNWGGTVDDGTLGIALQACSEAGNAEICRHLHFTVVSAGYDVSRLTLNTLVHTYGSCASMMDAEAVFDGILQPDLVSWNACIAGYAQGGDCIGSLLMFEKMQLEDVKPDEVTFLSLLTAYNHAGIVVKGTQYFNCMNRDYCFTADMKHYAVMIDLLGRAGDFEGVENILCTMQLQPDLAMWLSLLSVSLLHGNMNLGKKAFSYAVHLQPKDVVAYVLMSNILTDADEKINEEISVPDCALIEDESDVLAFLRGAAEH